MCRELSEMKLRCDCKLAVENNITGNNTHVELNSSTNSMKSILKKRDIQNGPSPMVSRSGSTSVEDWSVVPSSNRSATPAFPVRRETPLPFHPLLFEGAKDVVPPVQPVNNITYRSPSPRSIYYAPSHRTSISSTGIFIYHFLSFAISNL
uniref:Uncharacterized protein n=1 Tax=Setaria digitata TaxID=48799 RepID=A0A915Q509_9BILA